MVDETWAQMRTYMDHSWDVPDDHFTDDVLCQTKQILTSQSGGNQKHLHSRWSYKRIQ